MLIGEVIGRIVGSSFVILVDGQLLFLLPFHHAVQLLQIILAADAAADRDVAHLLQLLIPCLNHFVGLSFADVQLLCQFFCGDENVVVFHPLVSFLRSFTNSFCLARIDIIH